MNSSLSGTFLDLCGNGFVGFKIKCPSPSLFFPRAFLEPKKTKKKKKKLYFLKSNSYVCFYIHINYNNII